MNKIERRIKSSNKKDEIYGVIYIPKGEKRGIIQLSHGMVEHIGVYDHFMRFLAQNGFVCCGSDHLGHGFSSKKEDYGYFADNEGYKLLIDDLYAFGKTVRTDYPNLPYILFGHSMGSFIARLFASKYGDELSALIISGTGGKNPVVNLGLVVISIIEKIKGPRYISRVVNKMAFGSYNKRFGGKTGREWLTSDLSMISQNIKDPKCNFKFTVSAMGDLAKMNKLSNKRRWFDSFRKNLPILIFSGSMDPVGDYGKGVQWVCDGLKLAEVQDVRLHIFGGGRHEMLNERNRDEVYALILGFLNSIFEGG